MSLEERKILGYAKNIKDLPDYPIDRNMTADELKAYFDGRTDEEVMNSINGIIDDLLSPNAASQIRTMGGKSIEACLEAQSEIAVMTDMRVTDLEDRITANQNECQNTAFELGQKILDVSSNSRGQISSVSAKVTSHTNDKSNPHEVTASQISTTLDKNVDVVLNEHDVLLADLKEDLDDIDLALDGILNIQEALIGGESA